MWTEWVFGPYVKWQVGHHDENRMLILGGVCGKSKRL